MALTLLCRLQSSFSPASAMNWTPFSPRRSFRRLRSLHLPNRQASSKQLSLSKAESQPNEVVPFEKPSIPLRPIRRASLDGRSVVTLALIVSAIFIFVLCICFLGADNADEEYFQLMLQKTAETNPGLVLIGESVDVDIDEPALTVRWALYACGQDWMLPGSSGVHGSQYCGLPNQALYIFVDNVVQPDLVYNPAQIPLDRRSGTRVSVQNLYQFDSDHVLDVHEARLYPFDTYELQTTLRAISFDNKTLPIQKLTTIDMVSSFDVETHDSQSYFNGIQEDQYLSRDMYLRVSRPGVHRLITMSLFSIAWIMTHITIGLVLLVRRTHDQKRNYKFLVFAGAKLIALQQFRQTMPDAPGLDGVLIDTIGFFPQMIISGSCALIILFIILSREIDKMNVEASHPDTQAGALMVPPHSPRGPHSQRFSRQIDNRPPPIPSPRSTSFEISQYEAYRLVKHMRGEYVFPPVEERRSVTGIPHRRHKTLASVKEAE
jgi:hypothetical protein